MQTKSNSPFIFSEIHKDYTSDIYTLPKSDAGAPSAKGEIGKMRNTYIRITALICGLILVVTARGGILFTMIRVNDANVEFVKKVTQTDHDFNISEVMIENEENVQSTRIVFNGFEYLSNRTDPDIGHYGRYSYVDGTSAYQPDTENVTKVYFTFSMGNSGTDEGTVTSVEFEPDNIVDADLQGGYTVYLGNEESRVIVFAHELKSIPVSGSVEETVVNEDDDLGELDIEAQQIFDKLIDEYNNYDDIAVIETGYNTSYALVIANSAYSIPMVDGNIKLYEYDAYVFHPLKHVFMNNIHFYILFIVMFIILCILTVILMYRMYVNRMNFEARTKNLTRSFAHELKTPLAVTQAYVENWDIVEEKDRANVSAEINNEVEHMNKMVNTLLNLSAMDSGDVELNLEKVELFDFSKACFKRMEQIAKERNMTVTFKKEDDDAEYFVMADFDMMNMVISNFLSNAIKYGKEKVEVMLSSSGSNVVFRIRNDGETISAKDLKKIWDLFYKKDKSRTDRMNSTGVGLAVNKSILELHKAKFGAESKSGVTTFWFEMKKAKE